MATIVTRAGKGSPLTNAEVDANFTNLNTEVATAATTATWAGVTGKPATLAGYGITDAQPVDADLTAIAALAGTSGFLKKTAADTWALDTTAYITASASITGNAATATALQTARTINGVSFNGTANITIADATKLPLTGGTLTGALIANTNDGVSAIYGGNDGQAWLRGWGIESNRSTVYLRPTANGTATLHVGFSSGSQNWGTINLDATNLYKSGNVVLHAGNYNSYSPTLTGTGASGTWGISVTGNAATATVLQTARTIGDVSFNGSAAIVPERIAYKDTRGTDFAPTAYPGISLHLKQNTTDSLADGGTYHGILNLQQWSDTSGGQFHQLGFTDNGNISHRVSTSGTVWGAWARLLASDNFNSYAPTLTGTGASGTWGISVTGNAATVTNGLVSTGSYADPAWLTSLASSKLTGTIDNARLNGGTYTINVTGSAGSVAWTGVTGKPTLPASQEGNRYTTDFNTILSTGFFNAEATPTNSPAGTSYGQLIASRGIDTGLQIYGGHTNDGLWFRGWHSSGATFTAWRTVLHSGNYNSYSPTLTGTGASGTWGISVTGSAATLTTGRTIALTGDVTYTSGSFNGSANVTGTATLSASGVTAGTYTKVTVDAKGRVTTGASLVAGDVPTLNQSTTGNAATATTLQTARTINGISFNGSANIKTSEWFHSDRDFAVGTLVTTDINYAVTNGDPFVLEIRGNSYNDLVPYDIQYQGYIYSDTIISHGGYSNGLNITGMVAINVGGNLCFWWPRQSYWNGFNVRVYTAFATVAVNRVTSITSTAKPTSTKEVALSANIRQSLHSSNYNSYSPTLTGVGASGSWGISVTGSSASTTGNAATATALQTARTINGVSFNGTANITVADSTKLPLAGGTVTGDTTFNGYLQAGGIFYHRGDYQMLNAAANGWITIINRNGGSPFINNVTYNGSAILHAGNYSSYSPSLTGSGASGTWGISVTGNAATVTNGLYTTTQQVVSGYKQFSSANNGIANASGGLATLEAYGTGTGAAYMAFHRPGAYAAYFGLDTDNVWKVGGWSMGANAYPILHSNNYNSYAPTLTGTGASGTWSINVTGNAGSATTAARASATTVPASTAFAKWLFATTSTSGTLDWNHVSNTNPGVGETLLLGTATNGPGGSNYYHPFNIEYSGISGVGNVTQMAVAYGTPGNELYMRGRFGGTWTGWSRYLNSSNYNSYSPTLTGTGASGTWGINITGSASQLGGYASDLQTVVGGGDYLLVRNQTSTKISLASAASVATIVQGAASGSWSISVTGSAATLTTARTLTLGATGKTFNGSANVAWTAAEMGVLPLSGGSLSGNLTIRNTGPTIFMRDTDNNSAMLHCNSNLMYILRGGNDTESWAQVGGYWPVYWDLTNNNATFGGSIWAAGNITAYSDERVKENWGGLAADFVERLAEVKSGTFDRTDIKKRQAGVSAQSMQKLLPEVVDYHEKEELLSVAYGNAALVSAVELAKDNLKLRARVERLEAMVEKLIGD